MFKYRITVVAASNSIVYYVLNQCNCIVELNYI